MLLMIALPRRAVAGTLFAVGSDPRGGAGIFRLDQVSFCRKRIARYAVRGAGTDEGHPTACAAISFKHHKELFSETAARNLP
jgi:hypothetical protein